MRKLSFVIATVLLLSCGNKNAPSKILPPEKMKLVLFDMVRADEFLNNYVIKDSAVNKKQETITYYEQVFKIHNTNRDQFYKSYSYYQQNPDKNKALYDSINALATRIKLPKPELKSTKAQ